jgi:hypothetical protein
MRGLPTALNDDYKEILKLHEILKENEVEHVLIRLFDGWQILVGAGTDDDDDDFISVIEHYMSYGSKADLLEYRLSAKSGVIGNVTAAEVYKAICEEMRRWER